VIDIQAGVEAAVAATKTYTAELAAIAMLSAALAEDAARWEELQRLPGWMARTLDMDVRLAQVAERYRFMEQCVVLGRGFNYATAFEWSLKLKELTYIEAEPYSSADFQHGPIAMVEQGFPVMAVCPAGKVFTSMLDLLRHLRQEMRAELFVISDQAEALDLAHTPVLLPSGVPEWLTPMVAIVPAQIFTYYLTRVRGFDTDRPRSIRKVTETH